MLLFDFWFKWSHPETTRFTNLFINCLKFLPKKNFDRNFYHGMFNTKGMIQIWRAQTHLLFLYLACPLFNWKLVHCNVLIVSICQPKITKDSIKSWIHRQKFATTKENATWPPSSLLKPAMLLVRCEQQLLAICNY